MKRGSSSALSIVLACAATAVAGCAGDEEAVHPSVQIVARSSSALTSSAISAINGSYTNCLERSGSWSLHVSGNDPLDHDPLTVIMNDSNCQLAITEIVASGHFVPNQALALTTTYAPSAASFAPSGGGPVAFLANGKLDVGGFGSNFQISILYSDDLASSNVGDVGSSWATVEGSTQTILVPAPDYTINMVSGGFSFKSDALKVVQATSGNVVLTAGTTTGSAYVVDNGTLSNVPTYASVAAAYQLGSEHALGGGNPQVPAAHFNLNGVNLTSPVVRTLIVSRTVNGVKAYQLFKITFKSP